MTGAAATSVCVGTRASRDEAGETGGTREGAAGAEGSVGGPPLPPPKGEWTYSAVELDDLGHAGGRLGRTDRGRRRNLGRNEGGEATCSTHTHTRRRCQRPLRARGGARHSRARSPQDTQAAARQTHSWCLSSGTAGEARQPQPPSSTRRRPYNPRTFPKPPLKLTLRGSLVLTIFSRARKLYASFHGALCFTRKLTARNISSPATVCHRKAWHGMAPRAGAPSGGESIWEHCLGGPARKPDRGPAYDFGPQREASRTRRHRVPLDGMVTCFAFSCNPREKRNDLAGVQDRLKGPSLSAEVETCPTGGHLRRTELRQLTYTSSRRDRFPMGRREVSVPASKSSSFRHDTLVEITAPPCLVTKAGCGPTCQLGPFSRSATRQVRS